MDVVKSRVNPSLSLEFVLTAPEDKMFDRKSCLVKVSDLAPLISAFANASGGTIVIGINERTKEIEGVDDLGTDKIYGFISAPKDCCKPMPRYIEEFLPVTDRAGKANRLLLLHIEPSTDQVIRTSNDSTFLRIGDRTKEVKGEDLRNLEYSKSVRHFEDEISFDARIEDLDKDLLKHYKSILNAEEISDEQLLRARGFIRYRDNQQYLTNAAVLLFAKNISQFYPNCRIRFIRYDGTKAKTGTD